MSYLNSERHRDWKTSGYLKIPGFFSIEEVNDLQAWVSEISDWEPTRDKWMHHYESTPGGPRLSRSENFVPYHTDLRATVTDGKVLDVVSGLMDEPAVLYKEKINYKYPGGGGYAAHQDAPAYEFIDYHITCLISVDPATSRKRMPLFRAGQASGGIHCSGRKRMRRAQNCLDNGVGCCADRTGGHTSLWFLHSSQESNKPFRPTETNYLSHLQCRLPRRLARAVLRRQTTGFPRNTLLTAQTEINKLVKSHIFKGNP